jgi:ribulose-phosphate 3-epimerase
MEIAVSLTSGDIGRLAEMAALAEAGGADRVHLDIEDGVFIPSFTVGPSAVAYVRSATRLPIEVHLQTVEPERWIATIVEGGADLVIIHPEATRYVPSALTAIEAAGARAGLALLLGTPLEYLSPLLGRIDHLLLMTSDPPPAHLFHPEALCRVEACRREGLTIEIDGGVTPEIVARATNSGARVLVVGRAAFVRGFEPEAVRGSIAALRQAAERT